ncbi:uncharacterized protein LOC120340906 isoform X2 [Styela clava]
MIHYEVSCSEKVKNLEKSLSKELKELKDEIEETDMLYGNWSKPISSVLLPKSVDYYKEERRITIAKILDVSDAPSLKNQGQIMIKELEASLKSDITNESLPLLLHQFFLDRMQSLVQCKHLHLLRWRRFCEHTAAIERLYSDYCKRLEAIDLEYKDAKHRAFRLSSAHTSFINKDTKAMDSVESEDIAIYLRWLITNLRCVKTFSSYLRILQWIPVIHRNTIDPALGTQVKPINDVEVVESVGIDTSQTWRHMVGTSSEYSVPSSASHPLQTRSGGLDKAFTGFISNELTQGIPPHSLELSDFRDHLEELASEYGITIRTDLATSADEMELFGAVNRQFKRLFNTQEECRTFYQYDCAPEGNEHWGIDSPVHCLLKPCNWTSHINIVPHMNALQEKQMKRLKQANSMDELLASQSRFLNVTDFSLVTESLKRHAYAVREPPTAKALRVTTHRKGALRSSNLWLQIYNNPELYKDSDGVGGGGGDADDTTGDGDTSARGYSSGTTRKESYDYSNTMQMLGLDEGEDTASNDPTVLQGAYLSFLHLRHLKMRDVRRQCLSLLNYFRSIERTITIYDGGLSLEDESAAPREQMNKVMKGKTKQGEKSSKFKRHASQKTQTNKSHGGRGKTRGLGSHHYINNTPVDYKVEENEFMEFGGISNHDDFYQLEEEADDDENNDSDKRMHITASVKRGHYVPHVQDQRGYYIIYELGLKDLKALEKNLLLIASHYIEKDKDHRSCVRQSSSERGHRSHEAAGEVDLSSYGHRDVDRFAVLLDAWTCELNFLHNKRELLDCFLEAYHNTFDPRERRELAQAITDIMYQRPRYDLKQDYFIQAYRMECACLRLKTSLVKQILTNQIEENRHYVTSISRNSEGFGLPFPIIQKQPIAVNLPKPALTHIHMFEFHPSLGATASRIPEALRHALRELTQMHKPQSQIEVISIEKQMLELAIHEWEGMSEPGSSYSSQVQKDLFSDQYCGDPMLIKDAVESLLAGEVTETDTRTNAERQRRAADVWKLSLETMLLRHRLKEAAWETEILSRIYKHSADEMGFGEYHLYLRLSQFEVASPKLKADPAPSSVSRFIPDDSNADRFVPNHLLLAANEIDEVHLPKFSFYDKTSFMTILMENNVLENLRLSVACQITHKNSLIVAVTQATACMHWKDPKPASMVDGKRGSMLDASDTRSTHSLSSTHTQGTARSGAISPGGTTARGHHGTQKYSSKLTFGFEKQKKSQEPFISIQKEKVGPRDVVVNNFIKKRETAALMLKKPGEIEKLKRQLITDFCKEYSFRMGLHATRCQIIACYSSILSLLEDFPAMRDSYFMLGRPNEKKRKLDDAEGMTPDPKTLHRRPRRVLSSDGDNFLNLWFIPHFTEVLFAFRNKEYSTQHKILSCWLTIASSLHDIIQCLHAHSRLGSSRQAVVENTGFSVAADWGGMEGVGAEMIEIQKQIEHLSSGTVSHAKDPIMVAEFLKLRKDVMFLEFDAAVRHFIRKLFLETENKTAYRAVTRGMHFALPALCDTIQPSIFQFFIHVPEPLDGGDETAEKLYPWISFEGSNGAFPSMYRMQWRDIENCMQLCLASLDDIERQRANGEILGTSILYQDVLQSGIEQLKSLNELPDVPVKGFIAANPIGKSAAGSRPTSAVVQKHVPEDAGTVERLSAEKTDDDDSKKPLSKMEQPISSYRLIKSFFLLCKQLDILKNDWGARKLHVEKIDSPALLYEMKRVYAAEVYFPVLQTIARDMGMLDYYDDIISEEEMVSPPPGAPEITIRARQVIQLLEALECRMLKDVRRRVSQEMSLVLAERSREETALPTDLWKKASIRETFTVNRPNIVEDFLHGLMGEDQYVEENGKITFTNEHLNGCVLRLAGAVTKRERENYEMYSMFYENILRHHHHLLYQKELELRSLKSKTNGNGGGSQIQAQFQLADRSHELILEITALRSTITEMRQQSLNKEQTIRQEVQKDYQELVQRLFEECFQLKARLAQYHMSLHENVRLLISETRKESLEMLEKLRNKNLNSATDERLKILQAKDDQLKQVQQEKSVLNILMNKLHALNHWRRSTMDEQNKKNVEKLSQELSKYKKELQSLQFISAQNKTLLEEQLQGARKALEVADSRLKQAQGQVEKEQRAQKEREYREQKEARNRQQLADAQKKDIDRMLIELEEKDKRLKSVTADNEKSAKLNHVNNTKVERKIKTIQTQLAVDRSLKLEAFDRVDDLHAHIMDYEHSHFNSGGSYTQPLSRATSAATSRVKSAVGLRSILSSAGPQSAISIGSPPYTPRVNMRPLSSMPAYNGADSYQETPLLQRPKTASGRLKSKIAATLLSEIDPPLDSHGTVVKLREITTGRK